MDFSKHRIFLLLHYHKNLVQILLKNFTRLVTLTIVESQFRCQTVPFEGILMSTREEVARKWLREKNMFESISFEDKLNANEVCDVSLSYLPSIVNFPARLLRQR